MAMKMDVWQWGDVKGVDEELCDNLALFAEDNKIDYMDMTEKEFVDLKDEYLMKNYGNKGVFGKKSIKERYEYKVDEITDIIRSACTVEELDGTLGNSCNILDDYAWDIEHGKTTWLSKHAYDEISIAYANCVQYLKDEYDGKKKDELIDDLTKFFDKVISLTESKKSARKSLKEGINDELIATSSDGETTLYLSDERQANHGKDPHYEFKLGENGYFTRYIRCDDNRCENVVLDWIKEFDLDISKAEISKIIKLHESKKSVKKSLKESKDSAFYDGIAKEFHFSKDEKTRYKDKTYISAIAVLFDRINNAIKTYGRNSDEEYNALNDCWEAISSAKQNGFNVDYDEDRWNKIAGLPNYH